jgi:hypothetical protein
MPSGGRVISLFAVSINFKDGRAAQIKEIQSEKIHPSLHDIQKEASRH